VKKLVVAFGLTGLLIALGIIALAYAGSWPHEHEKYVLALCPPSFGLMAAEKATNFEKFVIISEVCLANALLYALAGAILGVLALLVRKARASFPVNQ